MVGTAGRVVLGSLLLSCLASTGSATEGPNTDRSESRRSQEARKPSELPFTLIDGYLIVVEGRIGSHEHLKMALDTGSTFSVLRRGLAAPEFERRWLRVANIDQVLKQEAAKVPDFQLGSIKIDVLPMMLSSLEYLGPTGSSVDALIGLDVLASSALTIDFAHKKVLFGQARHLRSTVPIEAGDAFVSVEIRLGDQPLRLILDSGVPSILLYRDRLDGRMTRLRPVGATAAASLGGRTWLELIDLPPAKLARRDLARRAAVAERSPAGFLPGIQGYLSLAALRATVCSIDFAEKTLSWE